MDILTDRKEAGILLAKELEKYRRQNPLILGMPRGGVIVAFAIAQALNAELDVIVSRKIGAPGQPELAIGAIAPGDIVVLNDELVRLFHLRPEDIDFLVANEKRELKRRIRLYRGGVDLPKVTGRVVIIADDGLATGRSALAAVRAVKKLNPKMIVLAIGACAADSKRLFHQEVDEIICLLTPATFYAVGEWYQNFAQTSDDEVIECLKISRNRTI